MPEHEEALWDGFFTGAPRPRPPCERRYEPTRASIARLSRKDGLNPKAVAKWKRRTGVQDCPTGPREPRSSSLTPGQEAVVVAFPRYTLLALDDCLRALQATIAHPTRSSLHRCLHRHGIGRLPDACGDKPARRKFKSCPIGHVPIDPGSGAGAGVPSGATCEGKLSLFVAVDRTSKLAFARLVERAGRVAAARSGRPRTSGGLAFTCASWWRPWPAASTRGSSCNGIPLDPPGEGRPCLRAHLRPALAPSTAPSMASSTA